MFDGGSSVHMVSQHADARIRTPCLLSVLEPEAITVKGIEGNSSATF